MTSQELFHDNCNTDSDIRAHLQRMYALAGHALVIVEFGVRGGVSTSAWLHAAPVALHCYDINRPANLAMFEDIARQNGTTFTFTLCDTSKLADIPETDILFLDTLHNATQLTAELQHAPKVRGKIVLHDTTTNAWNGEAGGLGLNVALIEFLLANPQWRVESHHPENNGLTVLCRA